MIPGLSSKPGYCAPSKLFFTAENAELTLSSASFAASAVDIPTKKHSGARTPIDLINSSFLIETFCGKSQRIILLADAFCYLSNSG